MTGILFKIKCIGFKEPFKSEMSEDVKKDPHKKGVTVIAASQALSGVERSIAKKHSGFENQGNHLQTERVLDMIFIAGVAPKIRILDQNPRRCPVCGLNQAHYKRVDHYLSLFFIPVLRVKKGEPLIMCDRCEQTFDEFGPDFNRQQQQRAGICRYCGKTLNKDFKYCPYCGEKV